MQVRRKQVTYDGASYTIAPLTLEQTKEFLKPLDIPKDATETARLELYDQAAFKVICLSLNNALPDGTDESLSDLKWTAERCEKELDRYLVGELHSDILAFSGLKMAEVKPGEAVAASGSSSGKSVAA